MTCQHPNTAETLADYLINNDYEELILENKYDWIHDDLMIEDVEFTPELLREAIKIAQEDNYIKFYKENDKWLSPNASQYASHAPNMTSSCATA